MTRYQILFCFLLTWILKASGSHFYGAVFTFAPTGDGTQISISYRISWDRYTGDSYNCNKMRVQSQTTLDGEGKMVCFSACVMYQPLSFICTGFSDTEDWSTGRNTFKYDPGTSGVIKFGFRGNDWASLNVGGGGGWILVVTADTQERQDTGKINSSPTVDVTPILDLQYNCEHEIKLPVNDLDGDIVRCRFANNITKESDECGSICNSFPGLVLDEDKCTLAYNAVADTGFYAVAIQVEDFMPGSLSKPLSSIPVQFLVNVFETTRGCGSGPVFVPPTPEDGETFDLMVGTTFNLNITASSSFSTVKEVITIEPVGIQKSDPALSSNGIQSFLSIGVSWTPTSSDVGLNTFCFTAKDKDKISGPQRCVTLNVLERPKCITDCKDLPDGHYQSCKSCAVYASCVNGLIYDYRNCASGRLFWDDNLRTCEKQSTTCPDESPFPCVDDCKGINGGPFPSCVTCSGYISCVHGTKHEMHCAGNLKYDAFAKNCVFPDQANCTV